MAGLNISIYKDDKPVLLECGGEKIELRYKGKSSNQSVGINIIASQNVDVETPSSRAKNLKTIMELKEQNADLLRNVLDLINICETPVIQCHNMIIGSRFSMIKQLYEGEQ